MTVELTQDGREIHTRRQPGTLCVNVGGKEEEVQLTLTIVDTYYPNGRKDCTVRVPKIVARGKQIPPR